MKKTSRFSIAAIDKNGQELARFAAFETETAPLEDTTRTIEEREALADSIMTADRKSMLDRMTTAAMNVPNSVEIHLIAAEFEDDMRVGEKVLAKKYRRWLDDDEMKSLALQRVLGNVLGGALGDVLATLSKGDPSKETLQ